MSTTIIGRKAELKLLKLFLSSKTAEFLAIYGRRRIGKTFLIKQFFKSQKNLFFSSTGEKDAPMKKQIRHFTEQISDIFYNGIKLQAENNWDETFAMLTKAFETVQKMKK